MNSPPIIYRIDAADRIVSVNPAWREFAETNMGPESLPERVLGVELWSFIGDDTIRELYRRMVASARTGRSMRFCYRCDAPTERRIFEMSIAVEAGGEVEFRSAMLSRETRPAVDWLDRSVARSSELVRMCGWCGRVALSDGRWVGIEQAIDQHGALQDATPPRITHSICPECVQHMIRLIPAEFREGT